MDKTLQLSNYNIHCLSVHKMFTVCRKPRVSCHKIFTSSNLQTGWHTIWTLKPWCSISVPSTTGLWFMSPAQCFRNGILFRVRVASLVRNPCRWGRIRNWNLLSEAANFSGTNEWYQWVHLRTDWYHVAGWIAPVSLTTFHPCIH